ncbi:MAG: response regulator [Alphaproteobacteria bacterium]|nr:response regulator [Alphaproteobacteria bacterium]
MTATAKHILVIEDEEAIREDLEEVLRLKGYSVASAPDGMDGLRQISARRPDLVLCDRLMPGLTGSELLTELRASRPDLAGMPFVFLTALADSADLREVEHLQPSAYISKPVDYATLVERINQLLAAPR